MSNKLIQQWEKVNNSIAYWHEDEDEVLEQQKMIVAEFNNLTDKEKALIDCEKPRIVRNIINGYGIKNTTVIAILLNVRRQTLKDYLTDGSGRYMPRHILEELISILNSIQSYGYDLETVSHSEAVSFRNRFGAKKEISTNFSLNKKKFFLKKRELLI